MTSSYLSPWKLTEHENAFKIAFAHSVTLPEPAMLSGNALIKVIAHYTPIHNRPLKTSWLWNWATPTVTHWCIYILLHGLRCLDQGLRHLKQQFQVLRLVDWQHQMCIRPKQCQISVHSPVHESTVQLLQLPLVCMLLDVGTSVNCHYHMTTSSHLWTPTWSSALA